MAEEQNADNQQAPGGSRILRMVIVGGIIVLVPAILGLVTFNFVIQPLLAEGATKEEQPPDDIIPPTAATIEFPEMQGAVIPEDPNTAAPVLLYQVGMAVDKPETASLVESKMTYFKAMIAKLHRNRTRSELNDAYVQESIRKQARQEANILLNRMAPEGDHEVLEVMHLKFAILDL